MEIDENTIWCERQNHPELVVQDAKDEFGLSEEQCERLRFIMLRRGVNKWLYARLRFIKLKHDVKEMVKEEAAKPRHGRNRKLLGAINTIHQKMQNIAKMPRWIEWGNHAHHKMKNNEREIVMKGRHC